MLPVQDYFPDEKKFAQILKETPEMDRGGCFFKGAIAVDGVLTMMGYQVSNSDQHALGAPWRDGFQPVSLAALETRKDLYYLCGIGKSSILRAV